MCQERNWCGGGQSAGTLGVCAWLPSIGVNQSMAVSVDCHRFSLRPGRFQRADGVPDRDQLPRRLPFTRQRLEFGIRGSKLDGVFSAAFRREPEQPSSRVFPSPLQ